MRDWTFSDTADWVVGALLAIVLVVLVAVLVA